MRPLGRLSTEDMSDFCGQCHRTWSQIAVEGPHNINNVRFQPYRLTNSKCCDTADSRIRCVTCHMPKNELPGSHNLFSDHRIRIVRPGEPYPEEAPHHKPLLRNRRYSC